MPQLSVECIKCIDIMKSHISKEDGKDTLTIRPRCQAVACESGAPSANATRLRRASAPLCIPRYHKWHSLVSLLHDNSVLIADQGRCATCDAIDCSLVNH